MSATLSWPDIMLRLALAVGAGSLIGLDRGEHAQPACLRMTVRGRRRDRDDRGQFATDSYA
jgi:hypothetical protein